MSMLSQWVHDNKENLVTIAPFVGATITATVLVLTFYGTVRMTKSLRKSDMAVQFGDDFNELMEKKHKIQTGQIMPPTGWQQATGGRTFLQLEAYHDYTQFFSFQFNEFHAYQSGYVDRDLFTIWMRSRRREFNHENIHGVSYGVGWQEWLVERHRNARDDFTRFMDDVHRCNTDEEVDRVVGSYGPWSARIRSWLRRPCGLQCALTVSALAALVVAIIFWLH
jgi:hypothetical protein